MFGRKKAPPRTCANGHPQEPSWEQCPFCQAQGANGPSAESIGRTVAEGERAVDPGEGAVVVPRRTVSARALAGWLVVTNGEDADRDYRLHAGPNVLGKGADCDVIIRDAHASQRHAVIHCKGGEYTVEDLDSKYGTLLDDEALHEKLPLPDGARIRIGGTELRFRSFGS